MGGSSLAAWSPRLLCTHPVPGSVCHASFTSSNESCQAGQMNCPIASALLGMPRNQEEVSELGLVVFFSEKPTDVLYIASCMVLELLEYFEKIVSDLQNRFFKNIHRF